MSSLIIVKIKFQSSTNPSGSLAAGGSRSYYPRKTAALLEWFCILFIITMGDKANKKLCAANGSDKKGQDITLG